MVKILVTMGKFLLICLFLCTGICKTSAQIVDLSKFVIDAIHNLFTSNLEYKMLIGYKEIYESLENCCNLCAYAAEIIEQIVIKNI